MVNRELELKNFELRNISASDPVGDCTQFISKTRVQDTALVTRQLIRERANEYEYFQYTASDLPATAYRSTIGAVRGPLPATTNMAQAGDGRRACPPGQECSESMNSE